MNLPWEGNSSAVKVRVILVVTSQSICWYRCENSRITDRLKHDHDDEPQDVIGSCLWLKQYTDCIDASIELVVDTELDDLDRVKLLDSTHRFSRSWHIRKVLGQLRREYPDATVNGLPNFLYPEIASVLYSQLSDQISVWLEKLCDCGVVVSRVVTSTQLLCDLFRHYSVPVLLHMFDGEKRHRLLLTIDGMPLHLRQTVDTKSLVSGVGDCVSVGLGGNRFAEEYLCETLQYLSNSVFSSLNDVLVVFPRSLEKADMTEYPDEYLAKHLLGLQCDIYYKKISLDSEHKTVSIISVDSLKKGYLSDICVNKASFIKVGLSYAVTHSSTKFQKILNRSISTVIARRRALSLKRGTFMVFLLFLILVLASAGSGIHSIQGKAKFKDEHASLEANILALSKHASTLHKSPVFVMDSMSRIHDFEEITTPEPSQVMSSVAAVVKELPGVSLTGFSWSVLDYESDGAYVTVDSVSIRDTYWGEDSSQSKTMVEVSGQLVSESSLREKQSQLNDFIANLSKSENISALRIVSSPATSASSSHLMSESGGYFKIQFSIKPI